MLLHQSEQDLFQEGKELISLTQASTANKTPTNGEQSSEYEQLNLNNGIGDQQYKIWTHYSKILTFYKVGQQVSSFLNHINSLIFIFVWMCQQISTKYELTIGKNFTFTMLGQQVSSFLNHMYSLTFIFIRFSQQISTKYELTIVKF